MLLISFPETINIPHEYFSLNTITSVRKYVLSFNTTSPATNYSLSKAGQEQNVIICKSNLEHITSALKAAEACSHSPSLPEAAGAKTGLSGKNHRRSRFLFLVTDEVQESWTG